MSEGSHEHLFDAFDEHIALLDASGTVVWVNAAWARFAEGAGLHAPNHGVGLSYLDVCERARAECPEAGVVADGLREVLAGVRRSVEASYALSTSGAERAFVVRILRSDVPNARAIVIHRDVTPYARKLEETAEGARWSHEELRRTEETWRRTFDALDDPVVVVDSQLRVAELNTRATMLSEVDSARAVGRTIDGLGRSVLWQAAARLVDLASRSGKTSSREVDDGARTWSLTASPVVAARWIVVLARDITALSELQRSAQRGETLAAMGELVAGVAHEVRNPLFAISSTLDAFEAATGGSGAHATFVRVLRTEVDRLTNLMTDLLDYGRPARLDIRPMYVCNVLREATSSCAALAKSIPARIALQCPSPPPVVRGDSARLLQVFQNLLENALQHTAPGGEVTVEAREIDEEDETWLECAVLDRGPGFRADDLRRVFDPFFTRRRGGTGLGLAIVQRIVYEHGGRVTAENRAGGGAAVLVRLPAQASKRLAQRI